jgi:hypothetical protein
VTTVVSWSNQGGRGFGAALALPGELTMPRPASATHRGHGGHGDRDPGDARSGRVLHGLQATWMEASAQATALVENLTAGFANPGASPSPMPAWARTERNTGEPVNRPHAPRLLWNPADSLIRGPDPASDRVHQSPPR